MHSSSFSAIKLTLLLLIISSMDRQSNNELVIRVPPDSLPSALEEGYSTREAHSTKALRHKYLLTLITMQGVLLQLKQGAGAASLFDTDYPTMVTLIGALVVYGVSLIGCPYILEAYPNSDLEEFINKSSLLFGTLAFILETVILVPEFGLVALFLWFVGFVNVLAYYACQYLEKWWKSAVAPILHAFGKLKECFNMTIRRFTMKPEAEEQTGLP